MILFRQLFFWTWTLLFLLFAYWQWNDPDPILWISIYGGAALLSFLAAKGRYPMPLLVAMVVFCLLGAIYYYPGSIGEWIRQEWQQKDLSMKTQAMEEARETFGLLIVAGVLTIASVLGWRRSRRRIKIVSDTPARV